MNPALLAIALLCTPVQATSAMNADVASRCAVTRTELRSHQQRPAPLPMPRQPRNSERGKNGTAGV